MSNKFKSFLILILLCGSVFLFVPQSLAAVNTGVNEVGNNLNLGNQSPFKTITTILNVLMSFLSLLALCLILWGGFIYMTSNGSEEKIDQAKKILRNGAIGLIIILSAWGITYFILTKVLDATGNSGSGSDNCTDGARRSCGCALSGEEICSGGSFGSCMGENCRSVVPNKTSCDGNTSDTQCQADNSLCGSENICDATDCLCKPKASLGESCNANTTAGKCTADDNLCGPYLKCDSETCVCTGPPVITGISPVGGYCTNDQNRGCSLDSDCLGGSKCDTSTPNGTTNNFMTVYGYNFGTTSEAVVDNAGQVIFEGSNASQAKVASSPKSLNSNCINSWTDRQIIIAVPSDVVTGPIEVKREGIATNNTDTTNDDIGPKIADFVKNDISRPGLCQITPTQGALGSKVAYQGVSLKDSTAYFGEYSSAYKGINSTFSTDDLSGQTLAPSIVTGQTTTFVEKTSSGVQQVSNALVFIKEKDAEAGPYISSFYPVSGAAGQYVTILGSGFGNTRGSRQVLFGNKEASYVFPDVCSNSVWSNNQVVVKVPDGLSSNDYEINMNLGDTTINTDLLSPNNTFKLDPTKTLKTSICKIDPARGQLGDKVSLWGEYFGNSGTQASVVFNRGISTSSKIIKDGKADKIETNVPVSDANVPAITGPVHVLKNGEWGNEVNFTVGKCSSNDECGASSPVCCPANTYKTGSCEDVLLSCYFTVPNSVYETKFDTTLSSVTTDTPFDSCIAMASFYKGCQTGQFCPNSPGKCSPFAPTQGIAVGSCSNATSECGDLAACKDSANSCNYNKDKDVCQVNSTKKCILENEFSYSLSGSDTKYKGTLSCKSYTDKASGQTAFVKQLRVDTSCPENWLSIGNGYCVNSAPEPCNPCPSGFRCTEDNNLTDGLGICESSKLCAADAKCEKDGENKYSCFKTDKAKCDCCCEIGQDTRDCCAPLKCTGTCGSDTSDDGKGYGSCSGCDIQGATVQQKDAACNCSTASGKFCDTSKTGGACTDCASLDQADCLNHKEQCCFDSAKGVCQGGDGTIIPGGKCAYYDCGLFNSGGVFDKTQCNQTATTTGQFLATSTCVTDCAKDPKSICDLIGADATKCSLQNSCCFDAKNKICTDGTDKINSNGINYCSYYNCNSGKSTCDTTASTTGEIIGLAACNKTCESNPTLPGVTCASESVTSCNTSFCSSPFSCLAASATDTTTGDCGVCCCEPGTKNGDLLCLADKGNCSGSSRGLFCGCKADSECGSINTQGCGSDTCCYGRPSVVTTDPKNNDQNVCRNRQIEVDFSQEMNTAVLADNILLVEEKTYGNDTCPNGTTLSFNNFKPKTTNFLVRLYQKITSDFKNLFSGAAGTSAIAAEPSADKLYCVSPIAVDATVSYANGATSTKVYIQPQKLLAAKTNYFVIVKGDENLDSNSGVMSIGKVGLNGSIPSNSTHIVNPEFNGVTFKNSYTFGFTTMSDNSGKNGLCTISDVVVQPNSFLINKTENDTSDDDPNNLTTYNKADDNDRAVAAFAYSIDKQLLQPISGYAWNWDWNIENPEVVQKFPLSGLRSNEIVVQAVSGVTDKSTKITASVNMNSFSNSNAMFDGAGLSGTSDVYVFLCANPWPMEINGTWNPWVDTCVDSNGVGISGCTNYNYKFYYCRDAGAAGTADDLPAVANPALILGSSGNLVCSTDGSSCNSAGAACGTSGTCIWNILKESYFFREAIPEAGEITGISSTGTGGAVKISWYTPIISSVNVASFKIYYGLVSGSSSSYVTSILASDTTHCSKLSDKYSCSAIIDKLTDGEKYYFKVSTLTDKKAESPLSGSQEATPTDTTPPAAPSWYSDSNTARVMFWSGKVNQHFDLSKKVWATDPDGKSGASLDKLTYCQKFYPKTVSVEAYKTETTDTWKSAGNAGNYTYTTTSYRCVLSTDVKGAVISNGKITISWAANTDDALYYRLFHGILAGKKAADSVDSQNNATSLVFDQSSYPVGDNFFYLAAIDKSGNVSATSDEIKLTIPASTVTE